MLAFKIKYDATVSVQTVSDWCKLEHQAKVKAQLESGAQADRKRQREPTNQKPEKTLFLWLSS